MFGHQSTLAKSRAAFYGAVICEQDSLVHLHPPFLGAKIGHSSEKRIDRSIEHGQAMIPSVYLAGCHGATVQANYMFGEQPSLSP